ncbi:electron transfer flavoprotein subunit beta/FixA family protein [Niallia endozanthoxylica]|uniref:Electron transfer flavoprotein subunit beta n=1 Tax=Niallia endozanthoxylica TaxID=2036016 RepID=A0A5J5I638_9BACI|nr:electron transfer flavoprotein subunit beta/FixA family protein [Niallia endozanthoxylica]KAA9031668.1 electron transfer flavoprotein subunit beta/FixA family protein [Niallia endozanthoxylica]
MKILVLLKQTFDTEEKIVLSNGKVSEDGVKYVINPYDEYAVEEAVAIKEKHGGEVTVVTIGPSRAEAALRTALAMGADKAIIVDDESVFGDEYMISKVLATVAKRDTYDLILGGYMAVDDGAAQVGPRLAEELGIAHISTITNMEVDGSLVKVEKDVEGDIEIIEVSMPVLVTAQQGLNEPRYPSLPGIMKAKKKPIERLTADDLDLNIEEILSKTEVLEQYLPQQKTAGKILQGELPEQVSELIEALRFEAKVV